ncbi:Uncharacterised protein [uncultured archaeon]|nr:Uncharacterised protein [uncultured archaeon]
MPDFSTIIQILSNHTALIAVIISIGSFFISIFSFYYGRKPIIHVTSKNIGAKHLVPNDYEFTVKNVSQNPAKDVLLSVKLIHTKNTYDIGEYKLDYLNPEAEDIIDISEIIKSKLENLKILFSFDSIIPEDSGFELKSREIEILKKYYEDNEFHTIVSNTIDNDFKITIEFKITCRANIPISMRDKFQYNFELSYEKYDLDDLFLNINEQDKVLAISYGYEDNFSLIIKPSNGKWR